MSWITNFWYEHLHLEISWILYVVVWEHWLQSYDGRVKLRSILVTNRDLLKCECFERSSTISWKTCLAWKLKSTWTVYIYLYFCTTTKCQMFYIKATFYLSFFCRPNRISWKKCAFRSTLSRLSAREIRCWKILAKYTQPNRYFWLEKLKLGLLVHKCCQNCANLLYRNNIEIIAYTQYPIIRNSDQRWALEFLKNYQFLDAERFLILQGWALDVS